MRRARLGCLLLGLACLVGCSSAVKPAAPLLDPGDARRLGYGMLWATSLRVLKGHDLTLWPQTDILVAIERESSLVSCVSLKDGRTMWSEIVGSGAQELCGAVQHKDALLVNSATRLHLLDPETGRAWSSPQTLPCPVSTPPALFGDTAIFGGANGRIFGHDLGKGFAASNYQINGDIAVRPMLVGVNVFAADVTGAYCLLSAQKDLKFAWKGRAFGPITAQPVASNLGIFVASQDQALYAVNVDTGHDRWKFRATEPLKRDPLLVGTTVLVPLKSELVALDAVSATTKELWRAATAGTPVGMIDQGLLVNEGTRLLVLSMENGKPTLQVPIRQTKQVILLPNKSLLLVTKAGRIQRYDVVQ